MDQFNASIYFIVFLIFIIIIDAKYFIICIVIGLWMSTKMEIVVNILTIICFEYVAKLSKNIYIVIFLIPICFINLINI